MAVVASPISNPLIEDGSSFLPLTATTLAKVEPFPIKARHGSAMSDVSTTCSGLDDIFLRTASSGLEDGRPCWTKAKVLKLGTDLLEGYSDPMFQEQLQALLVKASNEREVPGRMELAHTVQAKVLPKYGFEATPGGVDEMVKTIAPFMVDWMVERLVSDIEKKLGLPKNSTIDMAMLPCRAQTPALKVSEARTAATPKSSSPALSKAKVMDLLRDLLKSFSGPAFQAELKQLLAANGGGKALEVPGRKDLVAKVHSKVLPKYGLPGSSDGAMLMLDSFKPFLDDFLVKFLIADMDNKLGLPKDSTASMCRSTKAAEPVEESSEAKTLTREQVLALANELLDGFRASDFQEALQKLLQECSKLELRSKRAELALSVQSRVLPKYGFAGTTLGVMEMLEAFAPHAGDWMIARLVSDIDEKLGLPAETTLTTLYSFSA